MHVDSARFWELRAARQWSQTQLSNLSGLNLRTIQHVESGARISTESLRALAADFEVPAETLLAGDSVPSEPAIGAMRDVVLRGRKFSGTAPRSDSWWFAQGVAPVLGFATLLSASFGPLSLQSPPRQCSSCGSPPAPGAFAMQA